MVSDVWPKGLLYSLPVKHTDLRTQSQTVLTIIGTSLTDMWRIYTEQQKDK